MTKVKMTAPEGNSGMSVAGTQIDVIKGYAMVDEVFVDELKSHGFTIEGESLVAGTRADRIQLIVTGSRAVSEQLTDDELISFSAKTDVERAAVWEKFVILITETPTASAVPTATSPAAVVTDPQQKK